MAGGKWPVELRLGFENRLVDPIENFGPMLNRIPKRRQAIQYSGELLAAEVNGGIIQVVFPRHCTAKRSSFAAVISSFSRATTYAPWLQSQLQVRPNQNTQSFEFPSSSLYFYAVIRSRTDKRAAPCPGGARDGASANRQDCLDDGLVDPGWYQFTDNAASCVGGGISALNRCASISAIDKR